MRQAPPLLHHVQEAASELKLGGNHPKVCSGRLGVVHKEGMVLKGRRGRVLHRKERKAIRRRCL